MKRRRGVAAGDLFEGLRACAVCGTSLAGRLPNARVCSGACGAELSRRRGASGPTRACKVCGAPFTRQGRGQSNKQHCSLACARLSAKRSRKAFDRRRPERDAIYRARQKAKRQRDTLIERLWRKYPGLPRACESCGESRVLDVAHRPEHARRGAWLSVRVSPPEHIWILCPTCHALLDRLGYTREQLGLPEVRGGVRLAVGQ